MTWKKTLSCILVSLVLLTSTACGGEKQPFGETTGGAQNTDNGSFTQSDDVTGNGTDNKSPLSNKSDAELISQFLMEYDKALSAPAYFKEYNFNVSFDSDTLANSIGYFMVNGKDFSVDWIDYINEEKSAISIYKDGILYVTKDGEESQKAVETEAVQGELKSLGTVYREIPRSDFASQTLTRNEDGSFLLNITLTGTALQKISASALKASSGIPGTRVFHSAVMTLAFAKDGSLVRSRLIASVNVTAEDGTVRVYTAEEYLKYTSFDASKIVISAPEQTPEWEGSTDGVLSPGSTDSNSSDQTSDTTDEN